LTIFDSVHSANSEDLGGEVGKAKLHLIVSLLFLICLLVRV